MITRAPHPVPAGYAFPAPTFTPAPIFTPAPTPHCSPGDFLDQGAFCTAAGTKRSVIIAGRVPGAVFLAPPAGKLLELCQRLAGISPAAQAATQPMITEMFACPQYAKLSVIKVGGLAEVAVAQGGQAQEGERRRGQGKPEERGR